MTDGPKLLILMVGLPRSGKSTAARRLGFPIVSPDAIRLALHGQRFQTLAEPFVHAIAQTMVRALFLAGHETVVVDACHTTEKRRAAWQSADWSVAYRLVDTPSDVCLARAVAEGDAYIIPVIERMAAEWEPVEP